jgi:hypothetical protein
MRMGGLGRVIGISWSRIPGLGQGCYVASMDPAGRCRSRTRRPRAQPRSTPSSPGIFSSDLPRTELQRIAAVMETPQWLRARVLDLAHWAHDPGVPKTEQGDAAMEMCRILHAYPEMIAGMVGEPSQGGLPRERAS